MTNAPLNTADYEYASPERIKDLPADAPQQVPKKYCVLLLKGCCTEFTDCAHGAALVINRCMIRGHLYLLFKYSDALQCYQVITETEL